MSEAPGRPLSARLLAHPSGWPIAAKLSLVLFAVALVPMGVTAALDVHQAQEAARAAEHDSLRRLAESSAARIDQLLGDTRRVVVEVSGDPEVVDFLGGAADRRDSAARTLANVTRASTDISSAFLIDAAGRCVLTTRTEELGLDFKGRAYFLEALKSEGYVSEIQVGVTTRKPGVYFSQAVRHPGRGVVGVAVAKLSGEVVSSMVEATHPEGGGAFLTDGYGVVVAHTDPSLVYRSLAPLPAEVLALPVFDKRFSASGVDRIESLGLDALAREILRAPRPGSTASVAPGGGAALVGYAPVSAKQWTLAVYEPEARLVEPFARVTRRSVANALFVGAVVTLLALLLARTIVRPLRRLTDAARAVRRGDYAAAEITTGDAASEDEIGALSDSFKRMAHGLAERERELEIFGRMVSPEVREKLLAGNLDLGGETRWAAVLFSDIRGFSTLSETMHPQEVVALLNEYMTAMTAATAAYNGYVNNFIGDAIVVIFGAPIPRPDAERRAVSAALAMRDALEDLNTRRSARGDAPLATGIGIAAGEMVAGQIGSPERMLYTVIGDAVNVAARLEALTKDYPGKSILVSGPVAAALGKEGIPGATTEPLGPVKLKGRSEPVEVFAVVR